MAKLGNIFKGKTYIVTQSPHGAFQNLKAIDCVGETIDIYAPCDVKVGPQQKDHLGNPFFEVFNANWKIQFVHSLIKVKPGIYPEGKIIGTYKYEGDKYPNHDHVAIQIDGVWDYFLAYVDPKKITLKLSPAMKEKKWGKLSTYGDKQLRIDNLVKEPKVVIVPKPIIVSPPATPLTPEQFELSNLRLALSDKDKVIKSQLIEIGMLQGQVAKIDRDRLDMKKELTALKLLLDKKSPTIGSKFLDTLSQIFKR